MKAKCCEENEGKDGEANRMRGKETMNMGLWRLRTSIKLHD